MKTTDLKVDTTHQVASISVRSSLHKRYYTKKQLSLGLLIIQNASVSLLTRLSRIPTKTSLATSSHIYSPAVAVFTAELIKVTLSLIMLTLEKLEKGKGKKEGNSISPMKFIKTAKRAVWDLGVNQKKEILKLSVPAVLYSIQNTLLYTALSNLDAATYQTTYQLKLLSAALFSVLFFKRHLSLTKWASLFILTMGVAIVQIEQVRAPVSSSSELGDQNPRLGLLAILAACVSSGLAGGWFEYILKAPAPISDSDVPDSNPSTPSSATSLLSHSSVSTPTSPSSKSPTRRVPREMVLRDNSPSLWARNLQLSVPSLCFSLAGVFLSPERNLLLKYGPLQGFNPLVWSVVVNQAAGGLLVAMVVREADGVAKGFATSIAIVVSTVANVIFFGLIPGLLFLLGALLVMISTVMYARSS